MYLTQPPVKELVVYASVEDSSRRSSMQSKRDSLSETEDTPPSRQPSFNEMAEASVMVKCLTGVTMGMIVEAGIEAQRRGFVLARKRLSDRKDSGYVSVRSETDEIEVAVVEVSEE